MREQKIILMLALFLLGNVVFMAWNAALENWSFALFNAFCAGVVATALYVRTKGEGR